MKNTIAGAAENIRNVSVKIEVKDGQIFTMSSIVDISISRAATDGSFGIGFAVSDRLSCKVISNAKIPKKTRVSVYVSFGDDWAQLGRFYVDTCVRDGTTINIVAFDAMNFQSNKRIRFGGVESKGLSALTFPCSMQEMLNYICTYRGLNCDFECQNWEIAEKPLKNKDSKKDSEKYYTVREMISYIAACHGCNAKISDNGKLVFVPFSEASVNLTATNVIDCVLDDSEPFTVKGILISATDTTVYIDDIPGSEYDEDSDGIIKCSIPIIPVKDPADPNEELVKIANYMWTQLGNLSYYGGNIQIRGTGSIECGDVITIANLKCPADDGIYKFCVTGINYEISRQNGYVETLTSSVTYGSSDYSQGSGMSGSGTEYKAGDGIEIAEESDSEQSNKINLKPATSTEIGGIRVGDGLEVYIVNGKEFVRVKNAAEYAAGDNIYFAEIGGKTYINAVGGGSGGGIITGHANFGSATTTVINSAEYKNERTVTVPWTRNQRTLKGFIVHGYIDADDLIARKQLLEFSKMGFEGAESEYMTDYMKYPLQLTEITGYNSANRSIYERLVYWGVSYSGMYTDNITFRVVDRQYGLNRSSEWSIDLIYG